MEKHKCKLCLRSFSNGRALGGHMRSHMLNLPIVQNQESPPPPPPPLQPQPQPQQPPQNQLSGTVSASYSSSSSSEDDDDDDDDDEKGIYGLRENPKRSIRLVDPEFSFAVDAGSVVLQDRESETESSKNPTRKRSKRTRTLDQSFHHQYHHQRIQEQAEAMKKQLKFKYKATAADQSSWAEPEPVSSISDTTPEEGVAFCLMMLSRDKWKKQEQQQPQDNNEEDNEDDDVEEDEEEEEEEEEQEQEQEEDEAVESDESEEPIKLSKTTTRTRGKFKCETCKKTFRSYQALGGHRASHKKIKLNSSTTTPANNYEPKLEHQNVGTPEKKIHECPVCFRVFSSGQALGGHKRTHVTGSTSTPASARASSKLGQALIDLNLPAPMDDDDISQIEHSAVSDAEFVNPIRR